MSSATTRFQLRSGDVTGKVIDGEAIIMNLATGAYYSMDGTGADLWDLLEQGHSPAEAADILTERYTVERAVAARDVETVLAELVSEELLAAADGRAAPPRTPHAGARLEYAPPSLQKFTDMADLLALDPPMPGMDESAWGDATVAG